MLAEISISRLLIPGQEGRPIAHPCPHLGWKKGTDLLFCRVQTHSRPFITFVESHDLGSSVECFGHYGGMAQQNTRPQSKIKSVPFSLSIPA